LVVIISDCHGCYYTLVKLIERIKFIDEHAQFVFVGDYVDRGAFSKRVVQYVLDLQETGCVLSPLRGNHDDMMDAMLNGKSYTIEEKSAFDLVSWWTLCGFHTTLDDYGVKSHRKGDSSAEDILSEFREKVPQTHKDFFRQLPFWWENDTHFVGHGYYDPTKQLPLHVKFINKPHETLWERFSLETMPVWDKIGVFGHTPVRSYDGAVTPIKLGKLRLIDTCAFGDGYLCGYNCEEDDHLLQATDRRDIGGDNRDKQNQFSENIGIQLQSILREKHVKNF